MRRVALCAGIMLPLLKDQRILFHMCNKTAVFEIRLYSETLMQDCILQSRRHCCFIMTAKDICIDRKQSCLIKWKRILKESNVCWTVNHCNSWGIKNQLDVTCYFCFTYYLLNMFRTLIRPSSGACDCVFELPHRSSCSHLVVCWRFCCGWFWVVFVLQASVMSI